MVVVHLILQTAEELTLLTAGARIWGNKNTEVLGLVKMCWTEFSVTSVGFTIAVTMGLMAGVHPRLRTL